MISGVEVHKGRGSVWMCLGPFSMKEKWISLGLWLYTTLQQCFSWSGSYLWTPGLVVWLQIPLAHILRCPWTRRTGPQKIQWYLMTCFIYLKFSGFMHHPHSQLHQPFQRARTWLKIPVFAEHPVVFLHIILVFNVFHWDRGSKSQRSLGPKKI